MTIIIVAFFSGFSAKKVTTTMSSPTSMVVGDGNKVPSPFYLFFFFFLWSFWSSLLKLKINNEMVFFLMLKIGMAK
jgi:long-subunit fatty acid transport protein